MDEVKEARVARGSLNQLWSAPDSMPPLYAAALSGWLKAGSPESARWISAACGVASIMVVWLLGWEAAGAGAAVAVATLWALNPLQLYYAQMVRGYALYMLLIAMAMWLLFRALRTDAVRDWAGLVVVGVTGMFTHYYFALFLAVAATIAAMARRGSDWRRPTAAFAAIGLLAAPTLFCL
ncbi:MAG TPA: glycosyltransferase family 39 protein, partial [Lacipirellulaceae bacterium]|nr:glycosyltransferase family 39 protein [Lacipirellulaceae bacterium]